MKRHKLSIKKVCHIIQCLPKDYENIIYKFLLESIQKKEAKIKDDTDWIINIDETPYYSENPSKETILKEKKIEILTYGKNKFRFTAVLAISASGK